MLRPPSRAAAAALVLAGGLAAATEARTFLPTYDAILGGPSVLLPYEAAGSPYTGVGRYHGRATCTAFFLATALRGQEYLDGAPAYALTSARCVGAPGPNDVVTDAEGVGTVVFNYFADSERRQVTVPVARTVYATLKGKDLAVLELAVTYRDLVSALIRPWLVPRLPRVTAGDWIGVVGAPRWADRDHDFLRMSTCRVEGTAALVVEAGWQLVDVDTNRCRDVLPGSAGSPILSIVDQYVVGLVATSTHGASAQATCAVGHPCERVNGGPRSRKDTAYVTRLAGITACFDARHQFSLGEPECPLDRGTQLNTRRLRGAVR